MQVPASLTARTVYSASSLSMTSRIISRHQPSAVKTVWRISTLSTYHVTSAAGVTDAALEDRLLAVNDRHVGQRQLEDVALVGTEPTHHLDVYVSVACFTMVSSRIMWHSTSARPTSVSVVSVVDATANCE